MFWGSRAGGLFDELTAKIYIVRHSLNVSNLALLTCLCKFVDSLCTRPAVHRL